VTPAQIDKTDHGRRTQRSGAARHRVGRSGRRHWPTTRSVNLLDGPALAAVVDEVRQRHGKIDVLLHAGGIEIEPRPAQQGPHQFSLVFDIKADGFFSLLKAAKGLPIGATVAFSSVAGRFGNNGQTDYSAANDLLCKMSSSLRSWRPETKRHRHRLDGLGRDRHGHARLGAAIHGDRWVWTCCRPRSGRAHHPPRTDLRRHRGEMVVGRPPGRLARWRRTRPAASTWRRSTRNWPRARTRC
jgi:hypothetical protein